MLSNLQKIIAIGGGEIGRPKEDGTGYYPTETSTIDIEILRLTNKKPATLLFIPTASNDSRDYAETAVKHFKQIGFASVDVLFLLDKSLTKRQIQEVIFSHDVVYVGGGNTLKMMKIWRKLGIDGILKNALKKGVILSGLSAGAICWFSQGISDSRRFTLGSKKLIKVTGLGFIDAVHCPHYDTEPQRQAEIKSSMINSSKVAICLDNCAALEVIGDRYRIIKSKPSAKARKVYWKNGTYFVEEIKASDSFKKLDGLLSKD